MTELSLPSISEIEDDLQFFDSWEDKYRYIIDLGKQLPAMAEHKRVPEVLVKGCQSQVWLYVRHDHDSLVLEVDSDAHIVRGLLALVVSAYQGLSPAQAVHLDIESVFERLQLLRHLSPSRGNGLRAMVERVRHLAAAYQ